MLPPKRTIGTGITARSVVTFDWSKPGDLEAQVAAAIETHKQGSFQQLSERIVAQASQILEASGLPADPGMIYTVEQKSRFAATRTKAKPATTDVDVYLNDLILLHDYAPDSPEGYAARLLTLCWQIDHLLKEGALDEAMAMTFHAGELIAEAAFKDVWELDALRGSKVLASARAGHRQVHGSPEDRKQRHADYVAAFEQELAIGHLRMAAYDIVAKRFDVGRRTVQRAVSAAANF